MQGVSPPRNNGRVNGPIQLQQKQPLISYHRRMHYLFMSGYALFSCLFIIGCAIWINYRSIFQSGLIGFSHITTGILIGIYITSNVVEDWRFNRIENELPASKTERDEQRKRREYSVFRKSASSLIVVSVITILLSLVYLYNLGYIIIGICPSLASEDSIVNPTVINIQLTYQHKAVDEYYAKKNIVILRYNTTSQSIIRKTRHSNPSVANYDRWFVHNEIRSIKTQVEEQPLCINRADSLLFSFIENEVSHLLYKNLNERQEAMSIRITDKFRMQTTDEEEEDMDLHHLTSKICRHEYAFVLGIIIFLLLWDCIAIGLIIYCIYIIRVPMGPLKREQIDGIDTAVDMATNVLRTGLSYM